MIHHNNNDNNNNDFIMITIINNTHSSRTLNIKTLSNTYNNINTFSNSKLISHLILFQVILLCNICNNKQNKKRKENMASIDRYNLKHLILIM